MAAKTPKYAPIVQAIIDGEHDANLEMIIRGAEWRKKKVAADSGIRKGAKVLVAIDGRAGPYSGMTGFVEKVNKVRVTVAFPCGTCGSHTQVKEMDFSSDDGCKDCYGCPTTVGIPTDLLTVAS